jgi:hypothetical protein
MIPSLYLKARTDVPVTKGFLEAKLIYFCYEKKKKRKITEFLSLDHRLIELNGQKLFDALEQYYKHQQLLNVACPSVKESDPYFIINVIEEKKKGCFYARPKLCISE